MENNNQKGDVTTTMEMNISNWNEIRNKIEGYHLLRSGSGIELTREELNILLNGGVDGDVDIYLGHDDLKNTMYFYLVNHQTGEIVTKNFVEPKISDEPKPTTIVGEDKFEIGKKAKFTTITGDVDFEHLMAGFVRSFMDTISKLENGERIPEDHLPKILKTIIQGINNNPNSRNIAFNYLNSYLGSILPTFLWLYYGQEWFEELQKDGKIVQVFKIGKEDFRAVSNALNGEGAAFMYFALKKAKDSKYKYDIDIYISACHPKGDVPPSNYASMIKHLSADVSTPCPPYCKPPENQFPLLPT
jgi:hypothetical protein